MNQEGKGRNEKPQGMKEGECTGIAVPISGVQLWTGRLHVIRMSFSDPPDYLFFDLQSDLYCLFYSFFIPYPHWLQQQVFGMFHELQERLTQECLAPFFSFFCVSTCQTSSVSSTHFSQTESQLRSRLDRVGWFWDVLGVGTEHPPLFGSCPLKCFSCRAGAHSRT